MGTSLLQTFQLRRVDPRLVVGVLAILVMLSTVNAFRTLNRPGGTLEFDVSADAAGRLAIFFDRGRGIVDPLWTIRLDAGPSRRVILPLPAGSYTLFGFKPYATGDVRLAEVAVVTPGTRARLNGLFAVVHQMDYRRQGPDTLILRASEGATDPFGVLPGLDVQVPRPAFSARYFGWLLAGQLGIVGVMAIGYLLLFHIPDRLGRSPANVAGVGAMQMGGLFVVGILVMSARDLDVFFHPLLFAEDGIWLSRIYREGFWQPALASKGAYFVFGNFVILGIAKAINDIAVGASLVYLPQLVAVVTNAYYSLLALLAFRVLRHDLPVVFQAGLWLMVLMVPMGTASFEIVGRGSNMGYSVILLCSLLLVARERLPRSARISSLAADLAILACLLTNPLCLPVVFIALCHSTWGQWQARRRGQLRPAAAAWSPTLWLMLIGAGLAVAWKIVGQQNAQQVIQGQWSGSNLIEAFVARPLLYPFVFPFYEHMNDLLSCAAIILCFGAWAWAWSAAKATRRVLAVLFLMALYSAVCIIILRQNIVATLTNYATSGADRYFMGSVYFVTILTVIALGVLAGSRGRIARLAGSAVGAALLGLYVGNLNQLFVLGNSPFRFMPDADFRTALMQTWRSEPNLVMGTGLGTVRIPPHMRPVPFPAANIRASMTGSDAPRR